MLICNWKWKAWIYDYSWTIFPWNYFEPICELLIKIFTFLTVLSILVSTVELVEAIRPSFELFCSTILKLCWKKKYIKFFVWNALSILVSTIILWCAILGLFVWNPFKTTLKLFTKIFSTFHICATFLNGLQGFLEIL